MSRSLARFLARLSVDPKRLASYLDAPDRVMREAGLGRRDREALASGDQAALLARLYGPSSEVAVPAVGGHEPTSKEESMIWGYAPSDPSTHWHYAADAVSATAPMWFSSPPMWHQSGPAPAAAPSMWHTAAAPPPMWQSGPVVTHVSVVHVVHHFAGPAPAPAPSEGSGEGPRSD